MRSFDQMEMGYRLLARWRQAPAATPWLRRASHANTTRAEVCDARKGSEVYRFLLQVVDDLGGRIETGT
jgi:hypothetical protein